MELDPGDNFFDVIVYNGAPTLLNTKGGKKTFDVATNLPLATHEIWIVKRTESNQGVVTFGGFTITGGAVVPSPFPYTRRIEMIGDSITCGYGDLGASPCTFSAATESENVAWGAIAAKSVGAMHTAIAYSGLGVVRNYNNSPVALMPVVWARTFADVPIRLGISKKYTPDVVAIDLGTNDFSTGVDPGAKFTTGYANFLKTVRTTYPNALIVCAHSRGFLGTQDIKDAIATVADPKVSELEFPAVAQSEGVGCDGHPSQATQKNMGDAFAAHLHTILGW